ncbi:MAG: efflux RND transporter permease subunit [Myxococcota bacterium]
MSVPGFSIRQTVLVNVLFFVCLLGGWAALARIPVEYFPNINLNEVVIDTVWSGASAEEVERLVTQKLEDELRGLTDIDEMRSTSQANLSEIVIEFDETLDDVGYQGAVNDVRAALDRVNDLPPDAEEPVLTEIIIGEVSPAVMLAVLDVGGVGPTALREVARDVKTRVGDLKGANQIRIRGAQEREIRVLVDRDQAARYGLTVPQLAERIRAQNLNLPAGTFSSGSGESTLRAQGDFQSLEGLLATVVRENPGGSDVRLRDVARVETGLEKPRFISRYNGQPSLVVSLSKKDEMDVLDFVAGVDAWTESYRPLLPEGVELHKTLDTAAFVAPRMQALLDNLFWGVLFVLVILWFTIGFRNSALTIIAIPFSFLTAMIFFPLLDISINATTLVAMLLVSGMLVDDAIIVLENIYRRVEGGEPLREAVVNGAEEVLWPVVCAVATTCAAFAPLLLVSGTAGKFVSILPKAVIVCLLASLFECLLILPAHYLHFGSRQGAGGDPTPPRGALGRFFGALAGSRRAVDAGLASVRDGYSRALDTVLSHRFSFGALTAAVLFVAYAGAQHLPVQLFPGEFDTFNVLLETPADSSLERTDAVAAGIEREIAPYVGTDLVDFSTTVGSSVDANYDQLTGANLSISWAVVKPSDENRRAPERVLFSVRDRLEGYRRDHPEGIVDLRVQARQDGPPVGPPVEVRIHGEDWALGESIAAEMLAYLGSLPGVYNAEDDLKLGPPEVRLVVDEERAARHGLRFEDLARALRAANDGVVASSFRDPSADEDVDIRVLLEAGYRRGLQDLLEVELRAPEGYLLKLRDVADVEQSRGYRSYRRYDGRRTVRVTANVDEELATSVGVNQRLQAAFADVETRYPQVEVRYGGEFAETNESFAKLGRVFPIALLAIYMILAALFRSYLQPLVVTAAIPFGLAGIVIGVGLLDYRVSFVLMYATIGLTGVVVNDSLVMVDFINRARRAGMPLLEAVRQSGARRFRPILLTTLTTVVALLPMALGLQGSSKTYGPFAASIAFGLIVAMVGTLFAVPLVYTSLIVAQDRVARRWAHFRGHELPPSPLEGLEPPRPPAPLAVRPRSRAS